MTPAILKQASYTKAVIKETFRMNPISIGVGRILKTDTILNGYRVPQGVTKQIILFNIFNINYVEFIWRVILQTNVITQNQVICRLPEYFSDPNSYIPERWLRSDESNKNTTNPFLVIPFGHGPRSCIARRLAEQNMQILILKVKILTLDKITNNKQSI